MLGGLIGGGAGAATANDGALYNYAIHPDQKATLSRLEATMTDDQIKQLDAAACALTQCAAQLPDDGSSTYQDMVDLQNYGNSSETAWARDFLEKQVYPNGAPVFPSYSIMNQGILDYVSQRQTSLQLGNIDTDFDPNDPYSNHFVTQDMAIGGLEAAYENTLIELANFKFSSLLPNYTTVNTSGLGYDVSGALNNANGRIYAGGGGNANPIPSASITIGWLYSSSSSPIPDFFTLYSDLGSSTNTNIRAQDTDNFLNGAGANLSGCIDIICIGNTYSYGTGNAFEIGIGWSPKILGVGMKYSPSGSVTVSRPVGAIPGTNAANEKSQ